MDQFEEDHGELCDQLWEKINLATKYTLKKSYESGLMTQQYYDKVRNMFEYYVRCVGGTLILQAMCMSIYYLNVLFFRLP